jgi:uncharacterized enzyme
LTRGTELTFGIEEEFFVSHRRSRNVATKLSGRLIKDAKQALGQDIVQHELLQCQLELVSPVLETMTDAIRHVEGSRRIVGAIAAKHGLRLVAAGTHPLAAWREQEITEHPRYDDVVKGFQIVGRRNLFCGLHIHVRVPDGIDRVDLMNRAMRWLPLFLAFSTSSPFWNRQRTGLLSYRQAAYDEWPRSGIPDFFANEQQYAELTARLVSGGAMKDASFSGGRSDRPCTFRHSSCASWMPARMPPIRSPSPPCIARSLRTSSGTLNRDATGARSRAA